ncbi:Nif3-like dinuclear metal center hexameric protein [Arachidicoccus ginsenosidimutans]|uniref:Nif3-like dinuclear metal center hexameric protein n=1 Tax=Arachidicoccus sp. BS20 TaxID=1850526 RepID=UPI0007F1452E|nr:Nif3-like dinuclear metal center hexameric protein [Arachidicoccus sp. BS20]ANI89437.1 Nif3-like dinuclear metal center hexameric protein [Arachidicoccus sp. BS20]
MQIREIIRVLENIAPPVYQENYDNSGLLTGNADWECTGVLCTLDTLEATVKEAKEKNCNLIVSHHPIIFSGIKKLNGKNYVERTVIDAIKNDIAIYAIHTNLDNVHLGVNKKIADKLGLINQQILSPKNNLLSKLITYVPSANAEAVRLSLFNAGAGHIGNYAECSFSSEGKGTFKPEENTNPFIGEQGKRAIVDEEKIEVIFPNYLQPVLVDALKKSHPYEEPAFDIISLNNVYENIGSGIIGELADEETEEDFLKKIKATFGTPSIRHTQLLNKKVKRVAVCGGAGSFLIKNAIGTKADFYITSDVKYHEFFDADNHLIIADIGHWESEQFTIELLFDILVAKFPTFAVLKSALCTNPVKYFS